MVVIQLVDLDWIFGTSVLVGHNLDETKPHTFHHPHDFNPDMCRWLPRWHVCDESNPLI